MDYFSPLTSLFSYNIVLAILGLLPLHINLRIILLISTKQVAGILIRIAWTLESKLGKTGILTILILHFIELFLFTNFQIHFGYLPLNITHEIKIF